MKKFRIIAAFPILILSQVLLALGLIMMTVASRLANRDYTGRTFHAIAEVVGGGSEEAVQQKYDEVAS